MTTEDSKTCTGCGETKPLTDYYFEKGRPRARCKECHKGKLYEQRVDREAYNAKQKAWAEKNRPKLRAKSRAYREANREQIEARRRADRAANPEKYRVPQRASWDRRKERVNAERRAEWESDPKRREQKKAWEEANPDRMRAYALARQARITDEEREAKRIYNEQYYERNRERILAATQLARKTDPDRFRNYRAKRRALKLNIEYQEVSRQDIFERDQGRCNLCGVVLDGTWHMDHIVPVSLGGPHVWSNLQALCPSCNFAKGARLEGQIGLPL